ncbi:proteasome assembly chaperone family protein [Halopelagius fulvigenes]|uniref:Proteasome assembly chaperone family protein n=1 Tax=Halopelagius fulvigenes TaxID=1198324 RepID=A0ABD5TZC6_9EURY
MFGRFQKSPDFRIAHKSDPSETLLVGLSSFGFAGRTAADYLVNHLSLEERGHLEVDGLPSVTPFENGRPRHHTRLFSRDDLDVTVLVGDLFVPAPVGQTFADAVAAWAGENGVADVAVLAGVPMPHGPDEHRTYFVATDGYRERRLDETDVTPMGNGFLDGVNGALVERGLTSPLEVGVYVTPVHAQAPDVEASIRLVEAVESVYELGVDAGPLEQFAAEVRQHYSEIEERMHEQEADLSEDRMYM